MTQKLTRREKLMYGVGDIGFSLTTTILGAYFAIFLTDVVGIRPGIAAIAIFIGRTWDYINDPIFGYISDRTRTRWGRRRPYLLIGMLPLMLPSACCGGVHPGKAQSPWQPIMLWPTSFSKPQTPCSTCPTSR